VDVTHLQRARSPGARVKQARQDNSKSLALDVNAAGLAIAVSTRPVIPITAISMTLKSTHYDSRLLLICHVLICHVDDLDAAVFGCEWVVRVL
jgi:hypothetical protein